MDTAQFLRSLVELSASETIDALLEEALVVVEQRLGIVARIEFWDGRARFARGNASLENSHRTLVGINYAIGAIYLTSPPTELQDVELLARQLAPIAERLLELENSRRLSIREHVDRLYEQRIRDALVRHDWNASAVARELRVGRRRVARVVRANRRVFPRGTGRVMSTTDESLVEQSTNQGDAAIRCTQGKLGSTPSQIDCDAGTTSCNEGRRLR